MWPIHSFVNLERAGFAAWAVFSGSHSAQVGPLVRLNVALDVHSTQVMIVFVGAGGHVTTVLQGEISNNQKFKFRFLGAVPGAHSTEATGSGAEQFANLFCVRGPHCSCARLSASSFCNW